MTTTTVFPVPHGTGRTYLRTFQTGWLLLPIFLYLIFIMPVYVDNNGGSGLRMPQNQLAWACMVLSILLAAVRAAVTGQLYIGRFMLPAFLAVVLLILPWLWTLSPLWQLHALPRLTGIAGAMVFTFALCQIRLEDRLRRAVLVVVVFTAVVQATEAMVQAWLPGIAFSLMNFDAASPCGIFQQRNLLASWLATGYGVTLYLARTARTRAKTLGWVMVLYPLSAALVLSQSYVGALGAIVMTTLAALADSSGLRLHSQAIRRRVMLILSLAVWCSAISLWAMPSGLHADFSHPASAEQRLRVLEGTAKMIAQHPLAGSGLGSFESQFPQALEATGLQSVKSDTVTHPHNEVLYVMAEGGVVALLGLLLLGGIWLWPVTSHLSRRDGHWLLPLTGLPLLIHMMTEYPLYVSAPHLLLLLLLFCTGLPDTALRTVKVPVLSRTTAMPVVCLAAATVLIVLAAGFSTQLVLTRAEVDMNAGLIPQLPAADWRSLTQSERLIYDRHMLAASSPGFNRNPQAMAAFTIWGNRWLTVHNDAEVSAAMIFIARYRGSVAEAENLRAEAARVFVHDVRFYRGRQ